MNDVLNTQSSLVPIEHQFKKQISSFSELFTTVNIYLLLIRPKMPSYSLNATEAFSMS